MGNRAAGGAFRTAGHRIIRPFRKHFLHRLSFDDALTLDVVAALPEVDSRVIGAAGRRAIQSSIVSLTRCVITAGSSPSSNVTFRSNPFGPVIDTRTRPRRESAAIQAS